MWQSTSGPAGACALRDQATPAAARSPSLGGSLNAAGCLLRALGRPAPRRLRGLGCAGGARTTAVRARDGSESSPRQVGESCPAQAKRTVAARRSL